MSVPDSHHILHAPGLLDGAWHVYGNLSGCHATNGVLTAADCWAAAENCQYENFEFRFTARAPETSPEVQIWACFRHASRDFRYMAALRGGNQKQLYVARMGAGGYDKLLAVRPLEWSAMPGVWYTLRIVCAGTKIAVYVNEEEQPLVLCEDADAPFRAGCPALGSGYIPTEYRDVSIREVPADALDGVQAAPDYLSEVTLPPELRECTRRRERAMYRPYAVPSLPENRMELSLDGKWLFIPDYEVKNDPAAPLFDDSRAHVVTVPSTWIPLQAWLEGEFMGEINKGMSDNCYLEEFERCMNQTFDFRNTMSAWYRHYIDLPRGIRNKRVVLDFEAIALVSAVYCNGVEVHRNIGMFTPMQIDITDQIHEGRNTIAVQVYRRLPDSASGDDGSAWVEGNYFKARENNDSSVPVSDCKHKEFCTEDLPHGFYSNNPGGIWRSVRLILTEKMHVQNCWFRPALDGASIEVTCENSGAALNHVTLSYSLIHKTTGEFLCGGDVETLSMQAGERRTVQFSTPKVSPRLWGPGTPNLYRLTFTLRRAETVLDVYREQVGFRTVAIDGSRLIYNGHPVWVRGGNHMPAHMCPNNAELADTYMKVALRHNLMATRTHVAPWGSTWLNAADENGLMISLEGTWPWLMIQDIPSRRSLEIWKDELEQLILRNRNRPSLFVMTMNNEQNFFLTAGTAPVIAEKAALLHEGIRRVRKVLPDLPLICDSGYLRAAVTTGRFYPGLEQASGRYEEIIRPLHFDDGDIDDPHCYFGWYGSGSFHFMHGEFGKICATEGRPCMSQEFSVGYPRAEDGMPTRSYLFQHQVPQTLVGKRAYEYNDPCQYQRQQSFQLKELVEILRRLEHETTCGVMPFAFETWFYHHHDSRRIQPMRSAKCLKTAYQPVLASAQLYGRHLYAGETLSSTVTLINDSGDFRTLTAPQVEIRLTADGKELAKMVLSYEDLPYFAICKQPFSLQIPEILPAHRTEALLELTVWEGTQLLSRNEYDLLLADRFWTEENTPAGTLLTLPRDTAAKTLLADCRLTASEFSPETVPEQDARILAASPVTEEEAASLRAFAEQGGQVILLNQKALSPALLGGKSVEFTEKKMEVVTKNAFESSIFCGLEDEDLRWFPDGEQLPFAAGGYYSVNRLDADIHVLAETLSWHGYIGKPTDYQNFGGTPLFTLRAGKGTILVSSIRTDACKADPAACRINRNILTWEFDADFPSLHLKE